MAANDSGSEVDNKSWSCADVVSKNTYAQYMFVYAIGPVCISGIILNVLNIKTFTKINKDKLLGVYLLRCLAYSDITVLSTSFIIFSLRRLLGQIITGDHVFHAIYGEFEIIPHLYYAFVIPYFISLQVRNHMMVLVALERFLKLTFPLKAKTISTQGNANKAIVFVIILAIGCNIWRYWWFYFTTEGEGDNPCFPSGITRLKKHPEGDEADRMVYLTIMFVAPLGLLLLLNIVVITSLMKSLSRSQQLSKTNDKSQAAQHQLSLMTGCICTLFFICEVPACINRIVAPILVKNSVLWEIGVTIRKAGLMLITLDSSSNFFIYLVTNRKFRSILNCSTK
ncbi:FMRFamide receptor-like [Lineus longissimus]|uniref:FMRFamide receptor-like n=1 Tax=Lineus longissimus TaxID=88925 RepID=UPI002B4F1F66